MDGSSCEKQPINSHLISRQSWLQPIAADGHVYALSPDQRNEKLLRKMDSGDSLLDRIGLKKASVFPGFCAKHDDELFREIDGTLGHMTPEIAALIAYRAAARTYYIVQRSLRDADLLKKMDSGKPLEEQIQSQNEINSHLRGWWHARKDIEPRLEHLRAIATAQRPGSSFEFQCVEFDRVLPVVFCGGHSCDIDFLHRLRPTWVGQKPGEFPHMTQALIPVDGRSFYVMGWLRERWEVAYREVASCLDRFPRGRIPTVACRFGIDTCESFFVSPAWHDSLNERQKLHLEANMHQLWGDPHGPRCIFDSPELTVPGRVTRWQRSWSS